jgi:hypothetical protein
MRWVEHVAEMGEKRYAYSTLVETPERKGCLDLDADRTIIFNWSLNKCDGRAWTGFIWLRTRRSGGICAHNNEPSDSME